MVTLEEIIAHCRRAGGDWQRHIRWGGLSGAYFAPDGETAGIRLKAAEVRLLGRVLGWRESPAGRDTSGVANLYEVELA